MGDLPWKILKTVSNTSLKNRHIKPRTLFKYERYNHIYSNGDYLILQVIALYDDAIDKNSKRTEVHWAEVKHEVKRK